MTLMFNKEILCDCLDCEGKQDFKFCLKGKDEIQEYISACGDENKTFKMGELAEEHKRYDMGDQAIHEWGYFKGGIELEWGWSEEMEDHKFKFLCPNHNRKFHSECYKCDDCNNWFSRVNDRNEFIQ